MNQYLFKILIIWIALGQNSSLFAQNEYNIRLEFLGQSTENQYCYEVQLASANPQDLNLAGQNYRLYYNSEIFQVNWGKSNSVLPKEKYTPLTVKDNLVGVDASGVGGFSFENNLGFFNIGMDLKDEQNGGIILPASGEWQSTAKVCFDYLNQATTSPQQNQQVFWARPELTAAYATAYVEITEWINPTQTRPAIAANYIDADLSTSLEKEVWQQSIEVYPNPTSGKVWINYEINEALPLTVWSNNGNLLQEHQLPNVSSNYFLQLDDLPSGIYQIRIGNETRSLVRRIEKIQ